MSGNPSRRDFVKGIAGASVIASSGLATTGRTAQVRSKKNAARNAAMNTFTKALWVSSVSRSFPNGKKDIPVVLDKWAEAGFTFLFPEIRATDGEACYQRTKHPIAREAKEWDPVLEINTEAQKRGMKVHPWCMVFKGSESEFAREHPECVFRNEKCDETGHLCASQDAVQDWAYSFYEELMDNYDVAGVHLDYIRNPLGSFDDYSHPRGKRGGLPAIYPESFEKYICYCDYCKKTFKADTGIELEQMKAYTPEWARWVSKRIHNINRFVFRVQEEATKRDKETSAAVYSEYPWCIAGVGLDWMIWAQEHWIDYIIPMTYTIIEEKFKKLTNIHLNGVKKSIPVFEGIGKRSSRGRLTTEQFIERLQLAKNMGTQGFSIFSSGSLTDEDLKLIKSL